MLNLIIQHGIWEFFKDEATNLMTAGYESTPHGNEEMEITIEHLRLVFIIFGFGNLFAFFAFLVEIKLH